MTTQRIEKAWDNLSQAKLRYNNAMTFDTQMYWLKQVKTCAVALKDEIVVTLNVG